MGFTWLDSAGDPRQVEYARAYERAIKCGSIDSAISWELSGFKTRDGNLITEAPEGMKKILADNCHYANAIRRVDTAVRMLRASREAAMAFRGSRLMENGHNA